MTYYIILDIYTNRLNTVECIARACFCSLAGLFVFDWGISYDLEESTGPEHSGAARKQQRKQPDEPDQAAVACTASLTQNHRLLNVPERGLKVWFLLSSQWLCTGI